MISQVSSIFAHTN